MNFVEYLIARAKFSGLAGGVQGDIQALRVIENGTFEAPAGTAGYNPVVVNVLDPETGSPLKFTSGSFIPTADRLRKTIEHGLGCMPDFIMVYQVGIADYSTMEEFCEDLPILFTWGFKSSFSAGVLTGLNVPGWGFTQKQYGIDNVPEESQDSGYIYCPDESTFQVGMVSTSETGSIGLASGATYNWIAVAGLGTVSEPVVEPLAITENGTYNAPEGVDGYNPVTVNVPAPEIKLQDITITENGEYTADSGFDGLGKVLVDVAGSGGGSLPADVYWKAIDFLHPLTTNAYRCFAQLNGVMYAFVGGKSGSSFIDAFQYIYKKENDAWTKIYSGSNVDYTISPTGIELIEHNGRGYWLKSTAHYVFDGKTLTKKNGGFSSYNDCAFIEDGLLKAYSSINKNVYVLDETSDIWTVERTLNPPNENVYFYRVNNTLYAISNKTLYTYDHGAMSYVREVDDHPDIAWPHYIKGSNIYWIIGGSTSISEIHRLDITTGKSEQIGYSAMPKTVVIDGEWHTYIPNMPNCTLAQMIPITE